MTKDMDTAVLYISSDLPGAVQVLSQVEECHKCPLLPLAIVKGQSEPYTLNISTVYSTDLAVRSEDDGSHDLCRFQLHFKEAARYYLNINKSSEADETTCNIRVDDAGVHDANLPIYIFLGVVVGLVALWQIVRWILVKRQLRDALLHQFAVNSGSESSSVTSEDSVTVLSKPAASRRLQSLDTFRGLTLLLMIFVNNGGGGYWFFNHTPWNGLTIADLLFPWFMWIMGVSLAISMRSSSKKATQTRPQMMVGILRRSALLFLLGLLINSMGYKTMADLRIASVLGRFSVAYLVVASCQLLFLQCIKQSTLFVRWPALMDIVPFWPIWLISLIFPLTHILVTYLLPVPGCPTGYIGPGGLHDNSSHLNCTGGAAGYIDRTWLGSRHIYQWPTCQKIYQSLAFDPEGILGYLNSIFLVFLGLQAGRILTVFAGHRQRILRLLIWATLLGLIAGAFCHFSKNDGWMPVNKNLWSLSYILTSASSGMLILAVMYGIIDVLALWTGTPFFYPSLNSIVIYVGSEVLDNLFPFSWHMPDTHAQQFLMALWTTCLWWLISFFLFTRNVYVAL